jgi:hypothetical protein
MSSGSESLHTDPRIAFVISDTEGDTVNAVMQMALNQFEPGTIALEHRHCISSLKEIIEVLDEAAELEALVIHTVTTPELRTSLLSHARSKGVSVVDLIGPVVLQLANWGKQESLQQPGLIRQIEEGFYHRAMTIEFALRHDDGRNSRELMEADIILTGLSRTGKTPLTVYMAYQGWKVGNIPLAPEMDPPPVLFEFPRNRVFGLVVRPSRLASLRARREEHLGVYGDYSDPSAIRQEIQFANMLFEQNGWTVLDMTTKSIEEAAAEIYDTLLRQGNQSADK